MTPTTTTLANWPLNAIGWPIFTSTNDAFLYAQLIHDKPFKQTDLVRYREESYKEFRWERKKKHPDLELMMNLAVTAQFCREAFMEAARINAEKFKLSGG